MIQVNLVKGQKLINLVYQGGDKTPPFLFKYMSMDLGLKALSDVTAHTNKCPMCGKTRYFNTRAGLLKSNRLKTVCNSCNNSVKNGGKGAIFNDKGQKRCFSCDEYKDIEEFYGATGLCKPCSHKRGKEYNQSVYRYSRHGITKEKFEKLLEDQNHKCLICNTLVDEKSHIDHCHKSGKIRGILCGRCNKGLGQFGDDIQLMKNAIKYLQIYG